MSSMRASAVRLRFWSLSKAVLASSTRISSSTIEALRVAMSSRRLVSPSRTFVRSQGAELVEERLFGLQLLAEREARVACHESLQSARAWRGATHRGIALAPASPDAGNSM